MKKEKNSGNVKISKEILMICLLILFFIILVIVGRLIRGKLNNNQQNNFNQGETNETDETNSENVSGEVLFDYSLPIINENKNESEGADTLDKYEFVTESLKISDFEVSEQKNRLDITGNIENLTNEKMKNVRIRTMLFNEKNVLIQDVSSTISEIDAKSSKPYSFSKFSDYKEINKIKVELIKGDTLLNENSIIINKADSGE